MSLPLIHLPIDPETIVSLLLEPHLWRLLDHLPLSLRNFDRYSRLAGHGTSATKQNHTCTWALVTPAGVYVYIADPDAGHDISDLRGDVLPPRKMYGMGFGILEVRDWVKWMTELFGV